MRGLWHARAFAAVAILCLGIGIGLNTTIFSVVDGVLLQPYPYEDPDRLLVLGTRNDKGGQQAGISLPDLRDWKDASTRRKRPSRYSARFETPRQWLPIEPAGRSCIAASARTRAGRV